MPSTLELLERDWNGEVSLYGVEGESELNNSDNPQWTRLQYLMARAIIIRSEFPFVEKNHPNPAYKDTSPYQLYIETFKEIQTLRDEDAQAIGFESIDAVITFTLEEGYIFSEYVDKLGGYLNSNFNEIFEMVEDLADEMINSNNPVSDMNNPILLVGKTINFISNIGNEDSFALDRKAAQALGVVDANFLTREDTRLNLSEDLDKFADTLAGFQGIADAVNAQDSDLARNFKELDSIGQQITAIKTNQAENKEELAVLEARAAALTTPEMLEEMKAAGVQAHTNARNARGLNGTGQIGNRASTKGNGAATSDSAMVALDTANNGEVVEEIQRNNTHIESLIRKYLPIGDDRNIYVKLVNERPVRVNNLYQSQRFLSQFKVNIELLKSEIREELGLTGKSPPILVLQFGRRGPMYVIEGHTRSYVAKTLGQQTISAQIINLEDDKSAFQGLPGIQNLFDQYKGVGKKVDDIKIKGSEGATGSLAEDFPDADFVLTSLRWTANPDIKNLLMNGIGNMRNSEAQKLFEQIGQILISGDESYDRDALIEAMNRVNVQAIDNQAIQLSKESFDSIRGALGLISVGDLSSNESKVMLNSGVQLKTQNDVSASSVDAVQADRAMVALPKARAFGEYIRNALNEYRTVQPAVERKGLTDKRIANAIDISSSTLSQVQNGFLFPIDETLGKFSRLDGNGFIFDLNAAQELRNDALKESEVLKREERGRIDFKTKDELEAYARIHQVLKDSIAVVSLRLNNQKSIIGFIDRSAGDFPDGVIRLLNEDGERIDVNIDDINFIQPQRGYNFTSNSTESTIKTLSLREILNYVNDDSANVSQDNVDQADNAELADETAVGGIDFNPNLIDLKTDGNAIEFDLPVDLQQLESMPITGFTPVIFEIVPITNLPLLLGGGDPPDESQQLSRL